ncbi:hypothetical protein ABIF63_003996 [Bradyrhizobium japonicum]|uniref:Uncharacterized protein n=2 Tax=Bradyrhizobium japonicum TaxID=375 RepID=A0ABV2RU88_BRAJP|nr:hypothetical protein [Bradyrhizobium japonicum]UQD96845.1 hypothetical protein JEY30_35745 [Bradyrhizobium japonicum]WLB16932.1 hypothetical protein QIH95_33625 [Bradyrhizobium japonicum]
MRHIAIGNHINDTKFAFPAGAVNIPMLSAKASKAVDRCNSGSLRSVPTISRPC